MILKSDLHFRSRSPKKWSKIRSRSWSWNLRKSDLRSDQKVILRSRSWSFRSRSTILCTQLSAAAECSPLYYTAMDIGWNWKGGGMRKLRSLNTWALGQFPSMSLLRETLTALSYLASRYDFIFQKWALSKQTRAESTTKRPQTNTINLLKSLMNMQRAHI